MATYARTWFVLSVLVGAVPVTFGLLVTPLGALVTVGVVLALVVHAMGASRSQAVLAAVLTDAVLAATSWVGATALAIVLVVAATSPPAVRVVLRRLRAARPPERRAEVALQGPLTADQLAPLVQVLDDAPLCRAWTSSFAQLRSAGTSAERVELANLRAAYLDELEVRNPVGFHAWLLHGAHPAHNPAQALRPGSRTDGDASRTEQP